jgi:hypothetical protein
MNPKEALEFLAEFCDRHAESCLTEYADALLIAGATQNEIDNAVAFVSSVLAKDKAGSSPKLKRCSTMHSDRSRVTSAATVH